MGGKGSGRTKQTFSCGTVQKYRQHRKANETCLECLQAANAYARSRYKPRTNRLRTASASRRDVHKQMVRDYKFAAGSCMDCGLVVDERTIVCFDLDHRDPQDKSFTIAYEMGKADINAMRDEIAKCDVVCRNCHAIRTHEAQHHLVRRGETTTHLSLFD